MENFLNPQRVLSQLLLESNMVAADFGSGAGFWAVPLAKMLREGQVYAIDAQKEPLSVLQSALRPQRILNIKTIQSNLEEKGGSKLRDSSLDLVLMTNILFQIENKKAVFGEASRILKTGGKLLVVEWLPKTSFGPDKGRVMKETIKKMATEARCNFAKEIDAGSSHYGLLFEKN